MSKELAFTDDNDVVKYLDTTTAFNLALTADGVAFDLTNAKSVLVKIANDDGYIMQQTIDLTTVTSPLGGTLSFPINQNIMNTLVPDDYDIEVWVTMNDGTQAIFPSDGTLGFSIEENLMSDTGEVIPTITLNDFQQQFDDLSSQMENAVHNVQKGDKGDKGDTGQGLEIKDRVSSVSNLPSTANEGDGYLVNEELYIWVNGAWKDCGPIQGPQGIQGIQGKTGTGVSSTTIQYQISNSATTAPTGTWSNTLIATTQVNPFLWTQVTLNYDDGTSKSFYLVSSKGDKDDKGETGATGPVGPQGPVGAGLVVKGSVSNASQLPTTGNQEGYCYFVGTDLYIWDAGAWKNCGSVSPDLSNYVTVTDLNNALSTKVTDNKNGSIQINGNSILPSNDSALGRIDGNYTDMNNVPIGWWYLNGWSAVSGLSNWGLPQDFYYVHCFTASLGLSIAIQVAYDVQSNNVYVRTMSNSTWTSWKLTADDSKVVHTSDMRKPANDVAGIEEVNAKQDKIGYTPADDSKVAHLSGANNFDTVPTVNNNPLLLASSLPSDLARTSQQTNFTDGLQKSGKDVATTADVTNAVNAATANVVTTDKLANFTAGLQSGGVSVATSDDLKSVENSAWRSVKLSADAQNVQNMNLSTAFYQKNDNTKKFTLIVMGNPMGKDSVFSTPKLFFTDPDIKAFIGPVSLTAGRFNCLTSEPVNYLSINLTINGNSLMFTTDFWISLNGGGAYEGNTSNYASTIFNWIGYQIFTGTYE